MFSGSVHWASQDAEARRRQYTATVAALAGIGQDEIEGVNRGAAHCSALRCHGTLPAGVSDQTFDARHENLKQATKPSRASAALVDASNRHQGKGQQKVTVEHVHVQRWSGHWWEPRPDAWG